MSANKPSVADVERLREKLHNDMAKLLTPLLRLADEQPDNIELLQMLYEAMSRNMGALDAFMAMHLIPQDVREKTREREFNMGRAVALEAHEEVCEGCDGAELLRKELLGGKLLN